MNRRQAIAALAGAAIAPELPASAPNVELTGILCFPERITMIVPFRHHLLVFTGSKSYRVKQRRNAFFFFASGNELNFAEFTQPGVGNPGKDPVVTTARPLPRGNPARPRTSGRAHEYGEPISRETPSGGSPKKHTRPGGTEPKSL